MLWIWLIVCLAILSVATSAAYAESSDSRNPSPIISHIPRQHVESSAIAAVGYSKRRHILEIEFVNGAIYRYLVCRLLLEKKNMSAESKARFYDSNIRRHYRSVLVRPRHVNLTAN